MKPSHKSCALLFLLVVVSVTLARGQGNRVSVSPGAVTPNATSLNGPGNVFLTANLVHTGGVNVFGASPSVAIADFNGDGKPDIAVADAGADAVSILLGKGDGTFQAPIDTVGMRGQSYVAAGDLNGDGKADLAAIGFVGSVLTVEVLLGNGDATFTLKSTFNTFSNPHALVLRDFNGDGKLDLTVIDAGSNSVILFPGNGDGTFQAPITTSSLGTGQAFYGAAGDFNKDGKLDLAISDPNSNHMVVLLGNGNGTFQAARSFAFPASPGGWDVAVGDFNGDTIPDIAATSRDAGVVYIFIGIGNGNFQPAAGFNAAVPNSGPTYLALADFNKDGKLDILTSLQASTVGVLLGNGDGTFSAPRHLAANEFPAQLGVADFNGDGNPDWVAGSSSQMSLTVALGNGNGTFQDDVNYAVGVMPLVTLGDMNKDGKLDLVTLNVNSSSIGVLLGNGDGTFQAPINTPAPLATPGIAVGDFNNDGNPDVVVGNSIGVNPRNVTVFLGRGDGTFGTPANFSTGGSSGGQFSLADFNGDAKLDIAVVNQGDNTVSLLLGNGDATFQTAKITPALASDGFIGFIAAADLNVDGKMDLVVPDYVGPGAGQVAILLGKGDGTFQAPTFLTSAGGSTGLDIADLNKDGKLDLVIANQFGTVNIFLGNGNGTFNTPTVLDDTQPMAGVCCGNPIPVFVAVSDFNLDGNLDLAIGVTRANNGSPGNLVSNINFGMQLFLGTGTGTFTGPQDYLVGATSNTLAVGDFNRDGAPDVAAGDSNENFVSVLLNQTPPPIGVSPKSLTFGDQLVGTTSAAQAITVTNNGATTATMSIAASGDFAQTNTCGASLAAKASCSASVTFKPTTTGLRNGTLTITHNFPGSPQTVTLTGTGVAPAVTLAATSASFGDQLVGTTSAAQVVGLTNTGTAPLTISSITMTGANPGDFAQTNTCPVSPATLAAGANCNISATFKPTVTGNRAASVTITDSATGSPHHVSLTGTGTNPVVTLSLTTLNFGNQLVGTTSAAQGVTLTNSGSGPLTISSIALTGANSGDFTQTNTCPVSPATLAAGANCAFSATFKPTATGNRAANVTITDNAAGSPQNISLGGNGTDFTLEVGSGANCPAGGNCTTSATVTAGQSATYNLQVTPIGGFNGAVTLSSTGAPSEAISRETPSSVTPNGVSASGFAESVSTTAPSLVGPPIGPPNWPRLRDVRFLYVWFSLLLLVLALLARFRDLAKLPRRGLALAPALALVLIIVAWAGGCASGGGAGVVVHHPGTPKGTYTVTVKGTSNGVSHTLNLTLTVN